MGLLNNHALRSSYGLSSSVGTTVTSSASTNTKGSWQEIVASLSCKSSGIRLTTWATNLGNADRLFDIGVGGAGSEVAVVSNILMTTSAGVPCFTADFPIQLEVGDRISARCQASSGSATQRAAIQQLTGPAQTAANFTTLGADTSDSGGLVVDPGGTINTKGSWVSFGSVAYPVRYMWLVSGAARNAAMSTAGWAVDIGVGGTPAVLIEDIGIFTNSASAFGPPIQGPYMVDIPASQTLSIRSQCSINDAIDRLLDFELIVAGDGGIA